MAKSSEIINVPEAEQTAEVTTKISDLILKDVSYDKARRIMQLVVENETVKKYMGQLYEYHKETFFHCVRVAEAAVELSDLLLLDLNEESLVELCRSAMMHDIGKCGVEKDIIDKPAALTNEEFEVMKQHPVIGHDMLDRPGFETTRKLVGAHHIFQPGGYGVAPDSTYVGEMGEIIAAVDKRDALSYKRVYEKDLSTDEIIKNLDSRLIAPAAIKDMVIKMVKRNESPQKE